HSRRPCDGGSGRLHLPFRHLYDCASQGAYGKGSAGHAPRPRIGLTGSEMQAGLVQRASDRFAARESRMAKTEFTLADLEQIVAARARSGDAASWTAKLFAAGQEKAAKKLGEEAVETVI